MTKEERQARKDDAAAKKAGELLKAHLNLPPKLEELGHQAAADNIRANGRWDSPEVKKAAEGRDGR
ncbi:hypothetical protein [Kribbella sp. DT2]|uniref:hypothetical protein n=1 Tax=Kribbella sp. DT2 TaxID=3393427 RepID=UPI003CF8E528